MKEEIKAIKKKLEDHEKRISKIEGKIQKGVGEKITMPIGLDQGIKRLAKKAGITEEQVRGIFDFEGEKLTLIKLPEGNEREITQNATLVILLGYKYCFTNEDILAIEIRRNLAENEVSLNNFATHLNKIIHSLIRRKGKQKSAKTNYKLTLPGEVKAKKIINEMIGKR